MEPGDRLADRYELVARIGFGGMGEVWRAVQVTLDRVVAIKVIHETQDEARAALVLQRFQREAELVGRVDHRHVIDVIDYGTTAEGDPFLVMPFLMGETLEQRLRRTPTATLGEIVVVMRAILGGLAAIHDAGIVHRDLKPANVFLAQDSDGVVPKLLDFGISREGTPAEGGLTQENTMIGTPAYMAPEQFESARTVDHRADLFGLGAILYEALCGRTPYAGTDAFAVYRAVIETVPVSLGELRPELPASLVALVERAIAKDPNARWSTAREMRQALDALVGGGDLEGLGVAPLVVQSTPSPVDISGAPTAWKPGASPSGTAPPRVEPWSSSPGSAPPPATKKRGPWIATGILAALATAAVAFAIVDPFGEELPPPEPVPPRSNAQPPEENPSPPPEGATAVRLGQANELETLAIQWARLRPRDQSLDVRFVSLGGQWAALGEETLDAATREHLASAFDTTAESVPLAPETWEQGLRPRLVQTTVRLSLHATADVDSPDVRIVPHDTLAVAMVGALGGANSALEGERQQMVHLVVAPRVAGWAVARFVETQSGCLPLPGPLVRAGVVDAGEVRRTAMVSRTPLHVGGRRREVYLMGAVGEDTSVVGAFAAGDDCGDTGETLFVREIPGVLGEYFLTETHEGGDSLLVASWSAGAPRADGRMAWGAFEREREVWRATLLSADFLERPVSVSGRRDRALRGDDGHALLVVRPGEGRELLQWDGAGLVIATE